jgi:hypothetical protein
VRGLTPGGFQDTVWVGGSQRLYSPTSSSISSANGDGAEAADVGVLLKADVKADGDGDEAEGDDGVFGLDGDAGIFTGDAKNDDEGDENWLLLSLCGERAAAAAALLLAETTVAAAAGDLLGDF